jgi:tetratricopeptide (TPR) repeat protein
MVPKHYSPPPIPDATPPTKRVLEHLLLETPESSEIHSSLGTLYLRSEDYGRAISSFKTALKINPELSRMRTNLGIALRIEGEFAEAESQFREALIHDAKLEIATLELVELLLKKKDYEQALKMLERVLSATSTAELHAKAGECASALGQTEKAQTYFTKAAEGEHPVALSWLAEFDVRKGKALIFAGEVISGVEILSNAFHRSPVVFTGDTKTVALLAELTKLKIEDVSPKVEEKAYFELVKKFLSLGVVWEVFERFPDLEKSRVAWSESIKKRSSYPYGNYRLGIILAYQGKFMESLDALDLCRAQLPVKKQQIIKLEGVIQGIEEVRDAAEL